jgi:tetratricopeptide (TPR) repeat protein
VRSAAIVVCVLAVCLSARITPADAQTADAGVQAAFAALQAGDADGAAAAFRRVLDREPRNPVALYGAGAAAYLQARPREALQLLGQALHEEPRLSEAAALLGEIAYREGDLDLAIRTYENALRAAPANAAMRERLAGWRSEAAVHQPMVAFKDDRFTILFSGPANERLAVRAAATLRDRFLRIGSALGAYPSSPINVILYTDQQFRDVTRAPEWVAAGYDGQIRIPVRGAAQNLSDFDRTLTHELVHAMLSRIAPRHLPIWLHEGLAMYFDGTGAAEAEQRLAAARVYVPLSSLEGSFTGLTAEQANLAYEVSALATAALVARIGIGNMLVLLQDIDNGQPVAQAVTRFDVDFAAFEAGLARRVGVTLR